MDGNGWELQKENIRPLSTGRNVAVLKHNLETSAKSMADYEEETDNKIKVLEEWAKSYQGEDPLEPWLKLITFLESNLLQAKVKAKLNSVLRDCTRLFWNQPLYKEDKRYAEIYIKSLIDLEPSKRVQILRLALSKGVGLTCSVLYLTIAELEESIGKPNEAVKTLREGIQKGAQPLEQIKDALSELEYRVARRLAETVMGEPADMDSRNFGASVPVYGPSNEAPAFRTNLQSAIPVASARQAPQTRQRLEPIEIFSATGGTDDNVPSTQTTTSNPLVEVEAVPKADENKLNPSRWNKPDVAFESGDGIRALVAAPRERIQLYVDTSEDHSAKISKTSVQEGVLKERKDTSADKKEEPSIPNVTGEPPKPPLAGSQLKAGPVDSSCNVIETHEEWFAAQNLKMMCVSEFYSKNYISPEHRMMDLWLKKEKQKSTDKEVLSAKVKELEAALEAKDLELKEGLKAREKEFSRLEAQLKSKITDWEKQNRMLRTDFAQKETKYVGEIKNLSESLSQTQRKYDELAGLCSQIKIRNDELTAEIVRLQQQQAANEARNKDKEVSMDGGNATSSSGPSSAECTFLPKSSTMKASNLNQTTFNLNQTRMDPRARETIFGGSMDGSVMDDGCDVSRADVSDFIPPPLPKKSMAFTLYESHVGSFSNLSGAASQRNRMPSANTAENQKVLNFQQLSENIPPPEMETETNTEQARDDDEGQFKHPGNLGRPSAPPQSYVYTENLDETTFEPPRRRSDSPDFNLSNLTRALEFRPLPLLNSTPERGMATDAAQYENLQGGSNFIHTQRIMPIRFGSVQLGLDPDNIVIEGPASPAARERRRLELLDTALSPPPGAGSANNLSPIQETSKERSNCTTGSSSGNTTSTTRGGTSSMYNSAHSARSIGPRPPSVYRYPH